MPTINVRLAAILTISLAVVGGGVAWLHAFQVDRQARALQTASAKYEEDSKEAMKNAEKETDPEKKKAIRIEGEKDLAEAIRLLRDYVSLAPLDRGAEIHLGLLFIDAQQLKHAYDFLEEGLRLADDKRTYPRVEPDYVRDARLRMVKDVTMKIGPVDAMKAHLEILLGGTIDENNNRRKHNAEKPQGDPKREMPQGDAELLDLYGQALVYDRSEKEACEFYQDAITIAPDRVDTYMHLASVMRGPLRQEAEADAVIESMIAKNPKSVPAYEQYVAYFLMTGKKDNVDRAYGKARELLKLAPDDPRALILMGRYYYFKQDYSKAEEYLRNGIKASKEANDIVGSYKLLSDSQQQLGKNAQAIETLKQGADASQGKMGGLELLWSQVNAQIIAGKLKDAEPNIKILREGGYSPPLVDYLEARIAFNQQNWQKAEHLFRDSVIPHTADLRDPNIRYLSLVYLAQCYAQTNHDVKDRINALEQATKLIPTEFSARGALAEIYLGQGRMSDALEQYYEAMKAPQHDAAQYSLAKILIFNLLQTPETAEKTRDWTQVEKLLDDLIARKPGRPDIYVLKANMLLGQGKPEEAAKVLEESLKLVPKSADAWLALVQLDIQQAGKADDSAKEKELWKRATRDVDRAEIALGDHYAARLARGTLALAGKDPQINVSEVLKKLGDNTDAMSEAEKLAIWNMLGNMCIQANEFDLGRVYFRRVAEKEPKNLRVRSMLCDLDLRAFEKGKIVDLQELDRLIDELEQLSDRGIDWLYGKAIRALVQAEGKETAKDDRPKLLSEARGNLIDAIKLRKDWTPAYVLAGKICELQGEGDLALEFYGRAFMQGERNSDFLGRTVRLLVPRQRYDEAKLLFDILEKQKSGLGGEMQKTYVTVKAVRCKNEEIGDVEKLIEQSVAADSKDAKDCAWQGQLYACLAYRLRAIAKTHASPSKPNEWMLDTAMLKMAQRGVNSLLKATRINPQYDDAWTALVQLLAEIGQGTRATPLIEIAEKNLTGERAPLTIGACWEFVNEPAKAEKKYIAAADATPQNGRVLRTLADFYVRRKKAVDAEPWLRKIISLQPPATLIDTCWARRNLATILKGHDFENRRQALSLLDENLASGAATTEDRRLKVQFLMADPRKESLNDAVAGMEELIKAPDATPDDRFLLGRLYLRKCDTEPGDVEKTRYRAAYEEQMRVILGANRVQPRFLFSYILALMERKEYEDADRWLGTLEKVMQNPNDQDSKIHFEPLPTPFEAMQIRTEYLYRQGQYTELADKADNYVYNLKTPDRGDEIHLVAGLLEGYANRLKADHQPAVAGGFMSKAEILYASVRNRTAWSGLENALNNSANRAGSGVTAEQRTQIDAFMVSKVEEAHLVYAAFLARQGRIDEALAVLDQSWDRSQPELMQLPAFDVVKNRATTPQQFARLEKLLVDAEKDKPSTSLLLVLSSLYDHQRQYEKAIAIYREILAKEPNNFRVLNNIGVDFAHSGGNLDEALSMVNQALAITGPVAAILDSRAMVYIARNEYDKALDDLNSAIKEEGSAEQFFHLAWVLILLERKEEASAAFKTAQGKGLDPKLLNEKEVRVYDRLKDSL